MCNIKLTEVFFYCRDEELLKKLAKIRALNNNNKTAIITVYPIFQKGIDGEYFSKRLNSEGKPYFHPEITIKCKGKECLIIVYSDNLL